MRVRFCSETTKHLTQFKIDSDAHKLDIRMRIVKTGKLPGKSRKMCPCNTFFIIICGNEKG